MTYEVHASGGLASPAIQDHVIHRLTAAIGRFTDRITHVRVRLDDVNGPRHGGPDKLCTVEVSLIRGGHVIVRELRDDLYASISVAADRAKSVLTRRLAKRRG